MNCDAVQSTLIKLFKIKSDKYTSHQGHQIDLNAKHVYIFDVEEFINRLGNFIQCFFR